MEIFVDADACPVKEIIVGVAKKNSIPVTMLCDTSHRLMDGYSTIVVVDKARDSVDIKLINLCKAGDIVVTQDYGVAAMALGKGAAALDQNGMEYHQDNIDELLFKRHLGQKVRRGGGKSGSIPKRTKEDNLAFEKSFGEILARQRQK